MVLRESDDSSGGNFSARDTKNQKRAKNNGALNHKNPLQMKKQMSPNSVS